MTLPDDRFDVEGLCFQVNRLDTKMDQMLTLMNKLVKMTEGKDSSKEDNS